MGGRHACKKLASAAAVAQAGEKPQHCWVRTMAGPLTNPAGQPLGVGGRQDVEPRTPSNPLKRTQQGSRSLAQNEKKTRRDQKGLLLLWCRAQSTQASKLPASQPASHSTGQTLVAKEPR